MKYRSQRQFNYRAFVLMWLATSILTIKADNPNIWGTETNGVRAGCWFPTGTNASSIGIIPELEYGITTNGPADKILVFLPPESSRYKMALFDEHGKPVSKTKVGESIGKTIQAQPHTINWQHGYVSFGLTRGHLEPTGDGPLLLSNYFQITNSGRYRLELQIGIVWFIPLMKRDAVPQFLFLPPVDAEIYIRLK